MEVAGVRTDGDAVKIRALLKEEAAFKTDMDRRCGKFPMKDFCVRLCYKVLDLGIRVIGPAGIDGVDGKFTAKKFNQGIEPVFDNVALGIKGGADFRFCCKKTFLRPPARGLRPLPPSCPEFCYPPSALWSGSAPPVPSARSTAADCGSHAPGYVFHAPPGQSSPAPGGGTRPAVRVAASAGHAGSGGFAHRPILIFGYNHPSGYFCFKRTLQTIKCPKLNKFTIFFHEFNLFDYLI